MNAKSYEILLPLAAKNGLAGGLIYDAVIGTWAEQSKASTVLTFNAGDFTALGKDFAVVVPGSVKAVPEMSKVKGPAPLSDSIVAARKNKRRSAVRLFPSNSIKGFFGF
ncbi:MAG: hypothetical protein WD005_01475 [Haliea sp.]